MKKKVYLTLVVLVFILLMSHTAVTQELEPETRTVKEIVNADIQGLEFLLTQIDPQNIELIHEIEMWLLILKTFSRILF